MKRLLPLLACACATSPSASPRGPVTPAQLAAACDDLPAFRALLIAGATEDRAALERWQPPAPPAAADRPVVEAIARRWIHTCGLERAVQLTRALVAFPTVGAVEPAAKNPAFARLADHLRGFAKSSGLGFETVGANAAFEVTLGQGPRRLGYVMHADVVPADEIEGPTKARTSSVARLPPGWTHPPFEAVLAGDRLFGRGTEDDKGPIAAVLLVFRTLAAMGLAPTGAQAVAILGTGEESDWDPMVEYAKSRPKPDHVISVDADFPVVVAESGFVAWHVGIKRAAARPELPGRKGRAPRGKSQVARGPRITDARAGQFLTQVPGDASLTLVPAEGDSADALLARVKAAADAEVGARGPPFKATAVKTPAGIELRTEGAAVHSSTADQGANALWLLAAIARRLVPAPGAIASVLRLVAERFDHDHLGEKLGLAYSDPLMGALMVAPTVLRVTPERVLLSVNMRRPRGLAKDEFGARLDASLARLKTEIDGHFEELDARYVGEPAVADTTGPLVPTLLDIYRTHTKDAKAEPISIRGGTYARLFPGAVSFGPALPGHPYRGHAPDESIELEALQGLVEMLLEATFRLGSGTATATTALGAAP